MDKPLDHIPMIEADELTDFLYKLSDNSLDPERPFDGQPHTDQGERGKTEVKGVRFRDLADCFVLGFLEATGSYELAQSGTASYNDMYESHENDPDFDPMAVIQNMLCHVERRMGIYPNVPKLTSSDSAESD